MGRPVNEPDMRVSLAVLALAWGPHLILCIRPGGPKPIAPRRDVVERSMVGERPSEKANQGVGFRGTPDAFMRYAAKGIAAAFVPEEGTKRSHHEEEPVALPRQKHHKGEHREDKPRKKEHETDEEPSGIFCYALVTDPPEEYAALFARQLEKACDGWQLFSSFSDKELNIKQAYTKAEEADAIERQMHEMVIAGAWKEMAKARVLGNYSFIVKLDPDEFVRPSTLRKSFARYPHDFNSIVSTGDNDSGGTIVDGFLVAVPHAIIGKLYKFGKQSRLCDTIASGHNEEVPSAEDPTPGDFDNPKPCVEELGMGPVQQFVNRKGEALLAFDADDGKDGCAPIAQGVLDHFADAADEPFCGCKFGGHAEESCLSPDFALIHTIKEKDLYSQLVEHFP